MYKDKVWLKTYPQGVKHEIQADAYPSLVEMFEETFNKFSGRKAFVCMGKSMTYAELNQYSKQVAAWLQSTGLPKGSRIALMMPNVLQYPIALAAILRAGYIAVNVNPLYTPRELEHQLKDSGAEAIFILENFADTLDAVKHEVPIKRIVLCSLGDMLGLKGWVVNFVVRNIKKLVPTFQLPAEKTIRFNEVISQGKASDFVKPSLQSDDIAFLQYTGGTTGVSKGAMLTHRNILANILQCETWFSPITQLSAEQQVFVCALPLYHIFALTVSGMTGMRLGAVALLIPNPKDISGFIKEIKKYKVSFLPAVNTLYNALANHPDFASCDFSRLKCCVGGGASIQKSVADKWKHITGANIIEGYGLSETSPVVCVNPITQTEFLSKIGVPLSSTEVILLDDAGQEVPLGESGEIAVRGPQVMKGYWNRPDETAKVMTEDDFFKTGDIAVMDEKGYFKIVDRKKDMILVSGFNVYPNEVEEVVTSCPGVFECACIGVPDEVTGEAVKVFVVKKDPNLTPEKILEHCKHELTGYKKPKYIEFRTELPKSNIGKILRRMLRDEKK